MQFPLESEFKRMRDSENYKKYIDDSRKIRGHSAIVKDKAEEVSETVLNYFFGEEDILKLQKDMSDTQLLEKFREF